MQWPFKSTIRFAGQDGNVVRIQYGSWATRYLAMSLRKSWLQRGKRQRSLSSQTCVQLLGYHERRKIHDIIMHGIDAATSQAWLSTC